MIRTLRLFSLLLTLGCLLPFSVLHAQSNKEMESDIFGNLKNGDKAAIVAVHFGTSNDAARVLSIDRFNTALKTAFPNIEFREAWTSRIVIKRIKEKEIVKYTPTEVLEQLKLDGFTHILIQPSNVIEGTEMECLRHDVATYANDFKEIRISQPLLVEAEDYADVLKAESKFFNDKKAMNVLVCHGSAGVNNAQYTMLDYMARDKGYTNVAVATIEGYPTFDSMLKILKASGLKKVNLIPFLFVAGEHVQNDISNTWKKKLEAEGFKVKVIAKGIGENDAVIDLYVKHALHAQKYRKYSTIERKIQSFR